MAYIDFPKAKHLYFPIVLDTENLKSHIFFKENLKNVKEGSRQGFEFRNKAVGQCIGLLLRRGFCINSYNGFCIAFS